VEEHQVRIARGEREAEQLEWRDVAAVEAPGDGGGVVHDVLAQEHEPQRSQAEVDAAQPSGDGTEQCARGAGQCHRTGRGQWRRQAEAADLAVVRAGQECVAERAHRHEERVPEGELAGHTDQQGQADRADRGRHREEAGLQPEAGQRQRCRDREHRGAAPQQRPHDRRKRSRRPR
jgi:hypothetical protein